MIWAVASILAFFGIAGLANGADGQSRESVHRGALLFHELCSNCHTALPGNALPFGPPNLYDVFKRKAITSNQARRIIRQGQAQMPAFGSRVSNGQIEDLLAYLKKTSADTSSEQ